jgi:carboxymethylenebutenolidase
MKIELSTVTEWITVQGPAHEIPVFVAQPGKQEDMPALILIHEIFAVNDHIKDVAMRFAKKGFRVFAPDLFTCSPQFPKELEARNDLATMREVWGGISDSTLIDNLKSVLNEAKRTPNVLPDAIGTMGFCMGGAIAFMFASSTNELAWAVDFYGRVKYPSLNEQKPKHPIDYANVQTPPILGVFAGQDELITPEHLEIFRQKLEELKVPFELKVFENCPHAFFNDTREHYKKEEAEQAWQMALKFVQEHSRISPKKN